MQAKGLEFFVGLFILAGIAALVVLATKVGTLPDGGAVNYQVTARFENIGGLNVKAPVSISGVKIGRVSAIKLDKEDFSAKVTMAIEGDFDTLPLDTSAAILTSGLLGAQFVGLEPGAEEEYLSQGDEIELTQSTLQLEEVIGRFMFNAAENGGE
ncbi:MAG: phospholipid/cholesterol/gamma-HCH transport system substrate-binding protein [Gammaproteobacteria bacterium]|jgi:phospholipid/cholesterol/gamma-HCH transport system substrate-binding protein